MATMGNPSLPLLTIRDLIVSAMQLIIYTERLADGRRKITKITEIVGMQGDTIRTQDIFEFVQTGMEEDRIVGEFVYTGVVPNFAEKIKIMGIELPTIMQE
jgi:pilus assembly protein CpaF